MCAKGLRRRRREIAPEARAAAAVAEQVQLVHHEQVDLGKPRPVLAPVPGAGVEPLGGHHQQARVVERYRIRAP